MEPNELKQTEDNKLQLSQPITIGLVEYNRVSIDHLLSEEEDGASTIRLMLHGRDPIGDLTLVWDINCKEGIFFNGGQDINENNSLGKTARVSIANLPGSSEMDAVVDTGATTCSLHADSYTVNDNQIRFLCKAISPNMITMDLAGQVPIRTPDGGTENRPAIKMDLIIDGQRVPDVLINLNDRGHMGTPFLVGMNALQSGDFVVDPGKENEVAAENV